MSNTADLNPQLALPLPTEPVVIDEPGDKNPPPKPEIISPQDRLRAENLQLRLEKVQLQMQLIQLNLGEATKTRNGLVLEFNALRTEFRNGYGMDLAVSKINDDGTFVVPQAPPAQGGR